MAQPQPVPSYRPRTQTESTLSEPQMQQQQQQQQGHGQGYSQHRPPPVLGQPSGTATVREEWRSPAFQQTSPPAGDQSYYTSATRTTIGAGPDNRDRYGYGPSTSPTRTGVIGEASPAIAADRSTLAARSPFFGRSELTYLIGREGDKRYPEAAGDLVFRTDSSAAISNPAPLGFFSFGFLLLFFGFLYGGAAEQEWVGLVYGFSLALGGITQLLAGMWEFVKKNTFGATAFSMYGSLWIGLAIYDFVALSVPSTPALPKHGMIIFWALWAGFSFFLWLLTFRISIAVNVFWIVLTATFGCLIGGVYSSTALTVAGWLSVAAGFFAWYAGLATLANEMSDRELLPVGSYPELHRARVEKAKSYRVHEDLHV